MLPHYDVAGTNSGCGLLYIAMIFISGAMAGGLIRVLLNAPANIGQTGVFVVGRAEVYQTMNVYGSKMAGVFMFSTSTILLRTVIVPRWIAFAGYGLGTLLLLSVGITLWVSVVFPLWVFLISASLLLRQQGVQAMSSGSR